MGTPRRRGASALVRVAPEPRAEAAPEPRAAGAPSGPAWCRRHGGHVGDVAVQRAASASWGRAQGGGGERPRRVAGAGSAASG